MTADSQSRTVILQRTDPWCKSDSRPQLENWTPLANGECAACPAGWLAGLLPGGDAPGVSKKTLRGLWKDPRHCTFAPRGLT